MFYVKVASAQRAFLKPKFGPFLQVVKKKKSNDTFLKLSKNKTFYSTTCSSKLDNNKPLDIFIFERGTITFNVLKRKVKQEYCLR